MYAIFQTKLYLVCQLLVIVVINDNYVDNHNDFHKLAFKKNIAKFKYILIKQELWEHCDSTCI